MTEDKLAEIWRMSGSRRIVIDNNVRVSSLLFPMSIPGRAVRKAVGAGQILIADATLAELAAVLSRPKFDPYLTIASRQEFLRSVGRIAERVPVTYLVHACRDPKDNMILEVTVNGRADRIVTGDKDLLALGTVQAIPIVTPANYIESWSDANPS